MKRNIWILLFLALIAQPVYALKQDERGARAQALSEELSQVLGRALDEGLLVPTNRGAPPMEPVVPEPAGTSAAPEGAAMQAECAEAYPLDFTAFHGLSSYADVLSYRQSVRETPVAQRDLARAYLALDLGAEALINLRGLSDPEAQALRELARLLENRQIPNTDYFRSLAACHDVAKLWLALSLMMSGEPEGAALMDQSVSAFRQLPTQLRDRYAMIAIPLLDGFGDRLLGQKLIAGFTNREITNSSQLQMAKAVLDLAAGLPEGETALRRFVGQARFQEAALFALLRHGRHISQLERDVLLSGMLIRVEKARRDEDIRRSLSYVLEELSAASRYETIMEMMARPNLRNDLAQGEIRRSFLAGLERDLDGEDPLRALAAIEALVAEEEMIEDPERRAALYEAGVLRAIRLGFGSLADALARKANPGQPVAEKRAALAFERGETETLQSKAREYPENLSIARMVALAALREGERGRLAELSLRLTGDPESVLRLIEEDAATGRWIVPEPVYAAAAALTGDEERRRVRRVMGLRRAAQGVPAATGAQLTMSDMPETLLRSRLALESLVGEAP